LDYDVIVAGGNIGIFFAMTLQMKGYSVCLIEGDDLGSDQEDWHVSMNELQELKNLGILSDDDIDDAVLTVLPGCRVGVCEIKGIKNLGVSSSILIDRVAQRFKTWGGTILEQSPIMGVAISDYTGAAIDLGEGREPVTANLVLDCIGSSSPMARQERYGKKPDGILAVVGSCASGFNKNTNKQGDLMHTNPKIEDKGKHGKHQYFWEAFPVSGQKKEGQSDVKTTYLYTYMDADKSRPSMETLMNDYWKMLSEYQPEIKNPVTDLNVERVMFAYHPIYSDSPLKYSWSRMLAVDVQSPMIFGGISPLIRHIGRISNAVSEALETQCLHKDDLAQINAHFPGVVFSRMIAQSLAVEKDEDLDPAFFNRLFSANLKSMKDIGPRAINPFLRDVVRPDNLMETFVRTVVTDPALIPQTIKHVGLPTFMKGVKEVSMMGLYGFLDSAVTPKMEKSMNDRPPREAFRWRRQREAWKVGSGNDYNTEASGNE